MLMFSYKHSNNNDNSSKVAGLRMSLLASPPFETHHQTAAVAQGHHECKYLGDNENTEKAVTIIKDYSSIFAKFELKCLTFIKKKLESPSQKQSVN